MTPELLKRLDIPMFSAAAIGFGALLVSHHPGGMMPDEFWGLLAKKSTRKGIFPSDISGRFDATVMARLDAAAEKGKQATHSVGGCLAGCLLASEVLIYLLRDIDLVDREPVFAPQIFRNRSSETSPGDS